VASNNTLSTFTTIIHIHNTIYVICIILYYKQAHDPTGQSEIGEDYIQYNIHYTIIYVILNITASHKGKQDSN